MALVLPLLLLLIGGIIDFGFAFQRYEVLTNAAREGARVLSLPGYTDAEAQQRVRDYVTAGLSAADAARLAFPGCTGTVDRGKCIVTVNGERAAQVRVNLVYNYLVLGPIARLVGGSFSSVTLQAASTMRLEPGV